MSEVVAPPAAPAAAPAAGAAPSADWRTSLPDDIRSAPSLQDIKDIPSLAKSYVHAQSRIGSSISIPKDDAKPEEWDAHYNRLGRPAKAEEYKFSEVKLPEGAKLDDNLQKKFTGIFHKEGLSQRQADGVRKAFLEHQAIELTTKMAARNKAVDDGNNALMLKWGDKFEANSRVAKEALAKFATPELIAALDESGAGSDPRVVEAFLNIGQRMQEDNINPSSGGNSFSANQVVQARDTIEQLKKDPAFLKALHNRYDAGHKDAAKKWLELHTQAAAAQ